MASPLPRQAVPYEPHPPGTITPAAALNFSMALSRRYKELLSSPGLMRRCMTITPQHVAPSPVLFAPARHRLLRPLGCPRGRSRIRRKAVPHE